MSAQDDYRDLQNVDILVEGIGMQLPACCLAGGKYSEVLDALTDLRDVVQDTLTDIKQGKAKEEAEAKELEEKYKKRLEGDWS